MENQEKSSHIVEEELVQLVLDKLPFEREGEVLGHLAWCDACAELSRRLHEVSEALEEMAPAGAMLNRIATAVRSLMGWAPRAAKLAEELAAVALGGVVAAHAFAGGGLAFANLPTGAGGLAPIFDEGADEGRRRGAVPTLGGKSQPIGRTGAVRTRGGLRVKADARPVVEFNDSPSGLEVLLASWPKDQAPPTLAIVPHTGEPFRGEWESTGGLLRAEIDKPAGDFVLIFCGPGSAGR